MLSFLGSFITYALITKLRMNSSVLIILKLWKVEFLFYLPESLDECHALDVADGSTELDDTDLGFRLRKEDSVQIFFFLI